MRRPAVTWLLFVCCAALLVGALGWLSAHTLRLEYDKQSASRDAEIQERVRLALWRIESAAMSILIRENGRPPEHFRAFHVAAETFTKTYQPLPAGEVLVPSPLLVERPDGVLLFFQQEANGRWTSPQAPDGAQRELVERLYTTGDAIEDAAGRLRDAQPWLTKVPLRKTDVQAGKTATPTRQSLSVTKDAPLPPNWRNNDQSQQASNNLTEMTRRAQNVQAQISQGHPSKLAPEKRSGASRSPPAELAQADAFRSSTAKPNDLDGAPRTERERLPPPPDGAEAFQAAWQNGSLILLRPAMLEGAAVTQGVWLDWPALRDRWLRDIADLLPDAVLASVSGIAVPADPLRLVSLPVRLEAGAVQLPPLPFWSPLRKTLALAWVGTMLAALAVAILLHGALSLSERRAAFVSAVTHELRTPLSTFRLYTEMLKEGMVPDAATRRQYLETLDTEAARLQHLVENVLAYARLERGSARRRLEQVTLDQLTEKVRTRLEERAAQAGAVLCVTIPDAARDARLSVDVAAVEQILFNLVDNACKYGVPGAIERKIHLEADTVGQVALFRVRDHGRGIETLDKAKLFRPFHKSARDAAHSAPGVGLGLALCRRLSRAIGGDLRLEGRAEGGACFILQLPLAE